MLEYVNKELIFVFVANYFICILHYKIYTFRVIEIYTFRVIENYTFRVIKITLFAGLKFTLFA